MTDPTLPSDDDVPKKKNLGNRTNRRHTGRPPGTHPRRIRENEELLKQLGGDPPHVALLKIGRDERIAEPNRIQALSQAAHYFVARPAPVAEPRFLKSSPEMEELTDAASAVRYTAAIAEQYRIGKLDLESAEFFLKVADQFTRLHERVNLETEVEKNRELQNGEE